MSRSPRLVTRSPDGPGHGFVLVLPGGGYANRAAHEGLPVVEWLAAHGIAAGCLDYSVAPATYPTALDEVLATLAAIRAGDHGPVTGPVVVLGFSAGGHLAGLALTATEQDLRRVADASGTRRPTRPDAAVLCYPVVSMVHVPHLGSRTHLLGPLADDTQTATALSVERRVDSATPPVFVWHTADDAVVDVEHALGLATALSRADVPHELHVYPRGPHGLGLAQDAGAVAGWTAACLRWLGDQGLGAQGLGSAPLAGPTEVSR